MAYTLAPYDERQYFDDNGDPLAFGKINTYLSGTTTPVFTFADSIGTLNTNPVVLSASGRARIYLDSLLAYKFIVTDANDVPVGLTMDPVSLNLATVTSNIFLASTRGTAAAPAFSFVADPDTGIFSSTTNTLDVATSGAQRVRFHPTGGVSIGDTTDPGALNARIAGALYLIGSAAVTANALENRSGSLYFNNVALATGSSVSGTSGKLAKFTGSSTIGDSIVTESGTTVTVAGTSAATTFSGSGASLTAVPAGQLTGTITSATQDLITRLSTIVSGVWNAGAVTSSSTVTASGAVTSSGAIIGATLKSGSAAAEVASLPLQTSNTIAAGVQVTSIVSDAAANARVWDTFGAATTLAFRAVADAYASANNYMLVTRNAGAATILKVSFPSNVAIGGANITDVVAAPTINTGFGAGAAIAGKVFAFKVTCGTGSGSQGTIDFNATFANAPIITVSGDATVGAQSQIVPFNVSTTQASFACYFDGTSPPVNFVNGQIFYVHVRGY